MPKKISNETKQKAIELKKQGKSNTYISEFLSLSKSWCDKNLVGIEKNTRIQFDKLVSKSKEKKGVTKGEVSTELDLHSLPEREGLSKLNNTVARIRKEDKKNLVRPDWMHPNFARVITNTVVSVSADLEERANEEAYALRQALLDTCETQQDRSEVPSVLKLKNAILSITLAQVSLRKGDTAKLSNWLNSLYDAVNKLECRNLQQQIEIMDTSKDYEIFTDIEDMMY